MTREQKKIKWLRKKLSEKEREYIIKRNNKNRDRQIFIEKE